MRNFMLPKAHVLVVDDDPLVCEALEQALRTYGYSVSTCYDGQQALRILSQMRIDLCLADLYMPIVSGKLLTRQVRMQFPHIPVVIMTGDDSIEVVQEVLDSGASDFIIKPWRHQELPIVIERNLRRHTLWMEEQKLYLRKLNEAYSDMLEALLAALETREREIEGHCERVTAYTMILAEAMGVPHHMHPDIERGALLHDIGKIGIPDRILFKQGALSAQEWEVMRQHPVIGYRMCMRVHSLQRAAREVVLCHHERWDGSGYPQGLQGEDIPLGARLFAVADTLDAMTSHRPYRNALPLETAMAEIERNSGTQFDPQVVKAFLSISPSFWETIIQTLQSSCRASLLESQETQEAA